MAVDNNFGAWLLVDFSKDLARRCILSGFLDGTDIGTRQTAALWAVLAVGEQRCRSSRVDLDRLRGGCRDICGRSWAVCCRAGEDEFFDSGYLLAIVVPL